MLMIPVLTVPFLTLAFWALGGGSLLAPSPLDHLADGFNPSLPELLGMEENDLDKMEHYQRSSEDSSRFQREVKNDPYYQMAFQGEQGTETTSPPPISTGSASNSQLFQSTQEAQILQRLEALNRTIQKSPPPAPKKDLPSFPKPADSTPALSTDLDRLDQMMQQMQLSNSTPDPELDQMAELLDRILDIQHPERVQERMRAKKEKSPTFRLSAATKEDFPSLEATLLSGFSASSNGFYGLESESPETKSSASIKAVIHEDQTLVSGSTVKLRIIEGINLNEITLPKDQLVYGLASLHGERLNISIRHIRIADQILPVDFNVHDADGLEGIRIPGSLSKEVSSQSGSRAIQGLGFNSFDYSLEAQAAQAGIETAKSFLGKRIRQVKVNLKAGYQVWIVQNNR